MTSPPSSQSKRRVLIVDDEPDILWSLSLLLEPTYDVTTAEDGFAALRALEEDPVDAVVLDLMMPIMDGMALKREMDARGFTPPIVIVSASSDVAERAARMGVRDYMTKPVDIPKLEAILARLTGSTPSRGGTAPHGTGSDPSTASSGPGKSARTRVTACALTLPRRLAAPVTIAISI